MSEVKNCWIPFLSGEPKERPTEAHERQRGLLEQLETAGYGLAALAQIHEIEPTTQVHFSTPVETSDPNVRAERYVIEPGWMLTAATMRRPDLDVEGEVSLAMLSKDGHICVTTVRESSCEIQEPGVLPDVSMPESGFFEAQQIGPAMRGADTGKRGSLTVEDVANGCVAFNKEYGLGANLGQITELLHRDDPSVR